MGKEKARMRRFLNFFRLRSIGDWFVLLLFLFSLGMAYHLFTGGNDTDTAREDFLIDSLSRANDSLRLEITQLDFEIDSIENALALQDSVILSMEEEQTETIERYEQERIRLRDLTADEHLELFSRYTDADTTER